MGLNISWYMVLGKTKSEILALLHLQETARREEFPDDSLSGAVLPSGWFIILDSLNSFKDPKQSELINKGKLRLRAYPEFLDCTYSDTSNYSNIHLWRNGTEQWSVTHDLGLPHGRNKFGITGKLPANVSLIVRDYEQKQMFSIFDLAISGPIEICRQLTGFEADQLSLAGKPVSLTILTEKQP